MSMIQLTDITQQFGDKILYEHLNLQINNGEHIGLVGQNGTGKSTLIKMITGEILPDDGQIDYQKNSIIGYLDQYVQVDEGLTIRQFLQTAFEADYQKEREIAAIYETYSTTLDEKLLEKAGQLQTELDQSDFYRVDVTIDEMSSGLGLDILGMETQVGMLSGGQRSKIILAKLLLEKPNALILDEPTNHLDDNHVVWLTHFLQNFPGAFLVVSHDQAFLNQIVTHVADIEFGQLTKYTGNLKQALQQKKQNRESYLRQYHAQQKQIEKTEAYIRKYKAGTRATMAKSRQRQFDKIERLTPPSNGLIPNYEFPFKPIVTTLALETTALKIGYKQPLLAPIDLTIRYGEKIAIRGFNGVGKSTLLKTITGLIPRLGGSFHFPENTVINYFSQDLSWSNSFETPLHYLSDIYPKASVKELRRQLSRAGVTSQLAQEPLDTLSGGEQTRVKLCQMTMTQSNFLILDEPTNHIDQETKNSLSESLRTFPGTVIIVSHEQEFYQPFIDRIVDIGTS